MKPLGAGTFLFGGVKLKRAPHELLSLNTEKPESRRQLLLMAEEDHSETSQQASTSDAEKEANTKASPPVIEIHDSMTECEEEDRPSVVQKEDKAFVSSLHSFMKDRGTPIERIPHLGFKQINLWSIYNAVEKLGGYDSVTGRRLWKKVYDELGGSPGSTSAATCTRRHYEKLVLPFERHIKGEEDKPLPPSKPRKPYKRNLDGKVTRAERKRKRSHSDRDMDPEILVRRSPEASCQTVAVLHPNPTLHQQPNRAATGLCTSVYARLVQVPAPTSWTPHMASAAGEVISPLEKKKRVAQASLNFEDKERPSVIHQSPARASSSQNCNSSDGSPVPLSSSSSRSPSPYSVSSEDGRVGSEDKPTSGSELMQTSSVSEKVKSTCGDETKSVSSSRVHKDPVGQNKDSSHVSSQNRADSDKCNIKTYADWKPTHNGKHFFHPFGFSPLPYPDKSNWAPTSTSSFTKVIPKSGQPLRPAPIRPAYKIHQGRLMQQDDSVTKKLSNPSSWIYQAEKREKSRTMLQKVPPSQHSLSHSTSSLPVLSAFDKSGRDSRLQPLLHPAFHPSRMRLPQSQLTYCHIPVGPAHAALIGPAVYPYPYPIPLLHPPAAYPLPAMNSIHPHKR